MAVWPMQLTIDIDGTIIEARRADGTYVDLKNLSAFADEPTNQVSAVIIPLEIIQYKDANGVLAACVHHRCRKVC